MSPSLPILGPIVKSRGFAEPRAFAKMLDTFPQLRVVIAHLGGGSWSQTLDIAKAYPNTFFDCCEISFMDPERKWSNRTATRTTDSRYWVLPGDDGFRFPLVRP